MARSQGWEAYVAMVIDGGETLRSPPFHFWSMRA